MHRFERYLWSSVFIGIFAIFGIGSNVSAQTLFEWPDSRIDVSQYTYIESCSAVSSRVKDSVRARTEMLIDTLHDTLYNETTPLPPSVVEATRQCLTRFPLNDIPIKDLSLAEELYLIAGLDADANTLFRRHLSTIPVADIEARAKVIWGMAATYVNARPMRLTSAKMLVNEIETFGTKVSYQDRLGMYSRMMDAADAVKDTQARHQYGEAGLALTARVEDEGFEPNRVAMIRYMSRKFFHSVYRNELMDSLVVSTTAYESLMHALNVKAMGESGADVETGAGRQAPTVVGNFWFPKDASDTKYPRHGTVSLICAGDVQMGALGAGIDEKFRAILQRLKHQFPSVDLVLLVSTKGWFGPMEPPTAAQEADIANSVFREYRHLPITLAVTETPFWRVPEPDRRRINEQTENELFYESGYGWATLVDDEGLVVKKLWLGSPSSEEELEKLITVLSQRKKRNPQDNSHTIPQNAEVGGA